MASSPTARNSPPPLRAVLFDADHTLLDTSKAERCALRDVVDLLAAERADYNPASGSDLEGKPWTRPS